MSTRRNSAAIAVIGTGMMGPGIAACLALAGHRVALFGRSDQSVDRASDAGQSGHSPP
jgi:3-hydroxyacyl-CoA dehydrogenase